MAALVELGSTFAPLQEISRSLARTASSSLAAGGAVSRCVDRCCPTTLQARRSDTLKRTVRCTTASRRRDGLRIFQ